MYLSRAYEWQEASNPTDFPNVDVLSNVSLIGYRVVKDPAKIPLVNEVPLPVRTKGNDTVTSPYSSKY
jgi:hypothetical protein